MNSSKLFVLLPLTLFAVSFIASADAADDGSGEIVSHYLQATQSQQDVLRGGSMEVDISASVPKLQENGRLHALRQISRLGLISYRVLGFQGSNTVKSQVIARYLQAEQQSSNNTRWSITPANYKFKLKGKRQTDSGQTVYILALSPRTKELGLFKGEIWVDSVNWLPVLERGRLVKNPSIFFKKVDFERDYALKDGLFIPERMTSTIDTRLVGKVQLNVSYSNFAQTADAVAVRQASIAAIRTAFE